MTPRERLLSILDGSDASSAAVLCPGGMMSCAVTEVMEASGAPWPAAHSDPAVMLRLASAMREATGFANLAMPFCMTVEAESCGAAVNLGSASVQPRLRSPLLPPDGTSVLPFPDFSRGRAAVLTAAIRAASASSPALPVIGNLVGPFSLLTTLCDPLAVFRWTRRNPVLVETYLDEITEFLIVFALLQRRAGADCICIAEPTATGEILGGHLFATLVKPRLERLAAALRSSGASVILHICGNASAIQDELLSLPVDAVSFDSVVDIAALASLAPPWRVMGNVSPFLLESGPAAAVTGACRRLLDAGIRLIAPGCGIVPSTPVAHLRAMTDSLGPAADAASGVAP
jgi:[methyl-Co(III) methanol-specific corrinoid protein]:coenzyme M methyltransferase